MNLVDDIDAVFSYLRRYSDLVHEGFDILNTIIGSRVKLMDAV